MDTVGSCSSVASALVLKLLKSSPESGLLPLHCLLIVLKILLLDETNQNSVVSEASNSSSQVPSPCNIEGSTEDQCRAVTWQYLEQTFELGAPFFMIYIYFFGLKNLISQLIPWKVSQKGNILSVCMLENVCICHHIWLTVWLGSEF